MKVNTGNVILLLVIVLFQSCSGTEYMSVDGFTQGTTYHIVYSDDAGEPLDSTVSLILEEVDNSLSVYNPSSLISAINVGKRIMADSLLIEVFERSRDFYEMSGGLFDVSASALFNIWGFGFENRREVTSSMVDSALRISGMDKVSLQDGFIIRDIPEITLNFNAIAQGFTCDVMADRFDAMGIVNYLIEVGGEIMCKGVNPSGDMWSVGIDKPEEGNVIQGADIQDVVMISGRGLATSGNYRKFYEKDGNVYSHTINPVTGYPVRHNLLSATVIADDAMTADAYATWFMVVGMEKAVSIIEEESSVEAYLVYTQDNEYKVYKSRGIEVRK